MEFVEEQANLVYGQINSVTTMLDNFNARKAGIPDKRSRSASLDTRPAKIPHLLSHSPDLSRPPSTRSTLPIEILDSVLRCVQSRNDLASVIISNKHLSDVAVRIMYHSIRLEKPLESIVCLRTLSQNSRLALLVRSLDIHWPNLSHPTANLYSLALRAFRNTSSLNSLSIDVPADFHPWNFNTCSFQLKKFTTSFPCDQSLISFLETQPSLLDLTLRGFNSNPAEFSFNLNTFNLNPNPIPFSLSPDAMPRLSCLRAIHASFEIIGSILKGRPVTQVSMPLYADCVGRSLDVLKLASEPIERLNLISFDPNAPLHLLDEIANRLPDLEALHVVILLAQCSDTMLEALAPSLKKFKSLQYLTYMSAICSDEVSRDDEENIAAMWHQCCPTLKTIILPMGKVWFLDNSKWTCLEDAE